MLHNFSEPVHIAVIMGKMIGGGVESIVLNYYKNIDRDKVQFDFFIDIDSVIVPSKEINDLGGEIYWVPPYQNIFKYMYTIKRILKKKSYTVIHSNINTLSFFPLIVARQLKIPVRILHNHSTSSKQEIKKDWIKKILKPLVTFCSTDYFFPSVDACQWLLGDDYRGKNIYIIKDAIQLDKFEFNKISRSKLRKLLNYTDDDIVIGNIGRLVWQKNQKYLIEIVYEMSKQNKNIKLLIVGDGPLKTNLCSQIQKLDMINKVSFIAHSDTIEDYYQAMDLFVFPSNYEGLGMVAIEAQVSGLPTFCSTNVPDEANISDLFFGLDLNLSPKLWAQFILNYMEKVEKNNERYSRNREAQDRGYSIIEQSHRLTEIYFDILERVK